MNLDYAHRGTDVLGGAILGLIVAILITFQIGRVLWVYERPHSKYEADLQMNKTANTSVSRN